MCLYCSRRAHGAVKLGVGTCNRCMVSRRWQEDTMPETETGESRDGTGFGDHDKPYFFGHPRECLTLRSQARLTIMRGYVMDTRAGERGGAADGDVLVMESSKE